MKKQAVRKLEETSWLAQSLADMMDAELERNGKSGKWLAMKTLKYIVNNADRGQLGFYYDNDERTHSRLIVVPSIPSEMQNDFYGMSERVRGADGNYTMSVLVTHDLNSAIINVSKTMDAIRM